MFQVLTRTAIVTIVLIALLSAKGAGADAPEKQMAAVKTGAAPIIDGKLDDDCWSRASQAKDFSVFFNPEKLHLEQTIGRVCFDDDNLYISMECTVNEMDKFKARLVEADGTFMYSHGGVIEVFLDTNLDRTTFQQYLLHANGSSMVSLPQDDIFRLLNEEYLNCGTQVTDNGFNVEMSFPLAMLHLGSDTGKVWGFNLNRAHDLYDEHFDKNGFFSSWSSTKGQAFASPELFGDLVVDVDLSPFYWDIAYVSEPQPGDSEISLTIKNGTGRDFTGDLSFSLTGSRKESFSGKKPISLAVGKRTTVSFKHFVSSSDAEAKQRVILTDANGKVVYLGGTEKTDTTPGDSWAAPRASEKQQAAGYIAFRRPWAQPVMYKAVPKADEVVTGLSLAACHGEFEPVTVSLYPLRDVRALKVTATDLVGPGGAVIPVRDIDIRKVMWQSDWANPRSFEAKEHLLRRFDSLNLAAGRTQRFWLTVRVPAKAPAGNYSGMIALTSNADSTQLPLTVRVLPFELLAPDEMAYFMYYPGVKSTKFSNAEYFRKTIEDMRDHGMTSFTIYNWIKREDPNTGKAFVDVDNLVADNYGVTYADMMDILRDHGIGRTVPIMDVFSMHYSPEIIVELDLICRSRANWPEVLFYINDEIEYPERIAAARQVLEAIKKLSPEIKTTTAMGPKGANALGHLYDVWIGGTSDEMLAKCRTMGKVGWTYSCRDVADVSPAFERAFFGKYAWERGLKGVGLWSYAEDDMFIDRFARHHKYEGFEFTPECKQIYGHVYFDGDEVVPAVTWEGVREGIDDYRYMLTLKKSADRGLASDDAKTRSAAKAGLKLLKDITDPVPYLSDDKKYGRAWQEMGDLDGERSRIIEAIMRLQAKH